MATPQRALRAVTSDVLAPYLAEVRRKPLLTPEEEIALGRRIAQGDEGAVHELVEGNLRFVVQVALKYRGHGVQLPDLINEGNIGLMHAARKFDPERGTRFITYAVWWIRQAIMHALAAGGGVVRLPVKQAETLAKLRQKFEEIRHAKGAEPTAEELAQTLAMSLDEVTDLLRAYRPQVSLDAPGAQNDLQRATEIARAMILEYGMGDTLGPVTFPRQHPLFLPEHPAYPAEGHREYSEATAQALDLETKKLLEERLEHVLQLLRNKRPLLDRIAAVLLAQEVLEGDAFARMVREGMGDSREAPDHALS